MSFKLILFKITLFLGLSCSLAVVSPKDNNNGADSQTSATSAKLLNLGGLFGYGNTGYYPNYNRPSYNPNYNRPDYYPNYGYNPHGGYYPNTGNYPTTNEAGYYPNSNYYPTSGVGTNILGGGYGGYGGNGGLRQYFGYWDPSYSGQRNIGYGYNTNTNTYGLPGATSDHYGSRARDRVSHSFRGYD